MLPRCGLAEPNQIPSNVPIKSVLGVQHNYIYRIKVRSGERVRTSSMVLTQCSINREDCGHPAISGTFYTFGNTWH